MLSFMLISSSFSFGQTVNITDPETMISYRTHYVTNAEGQFGYIPDNIIPTPQEVIDVISTGELAGPIRVIRGPKDSGNITLPSGQTVWMKVCAKIDESWCALEWVGFSPEN